MSKYFKGKTVRLELNNKQKTLAAQHAGVSRQAYNWGLDECNLAFEEGRPIPTAISLHRLYIHIFKPFHDYVSYVSKWCPQESFRSLEKAIKAFHRLQKKSGYKKFKKQKPESLKPPVLAGQPQFKRKGEHDSFYLEGSKSHPIQIKDNKIKIPKFGWVKLSESFPEEITTKNVTVSKKADQWFISFKTEFESIQILKTKGVVGVDLGVKTYATCSDATIFESSRPLKANLRKLKIVQRKVSKAQKGSNNRQKLKNQLSKLHYQISCIRKDIIHKITTYLSKTYREIVIEDLNVEGMLANHKLAGAISDMGFYEFRRQLEYKTKWYGSILTIVDRWFASSKICSHCGNVKHDLKLSDRIYHCEVCGLTIDRDLNAAINLEHQGVSYSLSTCGGSHKPDTYVSIGDPMKQEANNSLVEIQDCISFA